MCVARLCSAFLVLPCSPCLLWVVGVGESRGFGAASLKEDTRLLRASQLGGRWTGEATVNLACLLAQCPVFCRRLTRTSMMTCASSKGCAKGCGRTTNLHLYGAWLQWLAHSRNCVYVCCLQTDVVTRRNYGVFRALLPANLFLQTVCVVQRVLDRFTHARVN